MPCLLPRPLTRPLSPWICHACLRCPLPRSPRIQVLPFHSTPPRWSDSTTNHYETLHLAPNAAPADIKRQFYTLSKKHHPDRNPDDPTASTRFVAISEAYHVLSVPEKRAQYDAELQARSPGGGRAAGSGYPQGSYSSASFGARPASGLNKKRSTFRGPPPSFYKAGGYGQQGAKRADYAHHTPDGEKQAGQESYGEFGGFGPGQQRQGSEVPHFDDRRHKETHDSIIEHINARRRRAASNLRRRDEDYARGDMLVNFVLMSAIIGFIGTTTILFSDRSNSKNTGSRKEEL